ncbi:hypothetical protein KHA80_16495 [Anaerobacillus sp. HL2]|nr:hypothetical protein KHA80_16495 [Anaerobacillus sp. HL2]
MKKIRLADDEVIDNNDLDYRNKSTTIIHFEEVNCTKKLTYSVFYNYRISELLFFNKKKEYLTESYKLGE